MIADRQRTARVLHVVTDSFSAFEFVAPLAEYLGKRNVRSVIACSGAPYADAHSFVAAMRAQGLDVRDIPMPRAVVPWGDAKALWELFRLLGRESFDLVHTHLAKAGLIGRLAARLNGLPVVHTVYDYAFVDATGIRRWAYRTVEQLAAPLAARILFISENERQISLANRIGRPEQLVTMGFGIHVDQFRSESVSPERVARVRARYGLPPDRFIVGTVARLVRRKGVDVFLRAGAILAERFPDVHLLVVGGGPLRMAMSNLAAELGIATKVTFTGFVDDQADMPPLFSCIDLFCLATRREGYGMVCAEAGAMGKAVVASRIPPLDEIVLHNVTGLLVPPDGPVGFADALGQLIADAPRRQAMGERARAHVKAQCDLRDRFSKVYDVYMEVLQARSGAGFGRSPVTP